MMAQWWSARTARERMLLAGMGLALGAALLVQGIWLPLERSAERAERARDAAADTLAEVRRAAALTAGRDRTATTGATGTTDDPRGILIRTAREAGLVITRLEPGPDGLSVWLDAVGAVDLHGWLADLSTRHGIAVRRASVRGNDDGATVRAQFLFADGGR